METTRDLTIAGNEWVEIVVGEKEVILDSNQALYYAFAPSDTNLNTRGHYLSRATSLQRKLPDGVGLWVKNAISREPTATMVLTLTEIDVVQ